MPTRNINLTDHYDDFLAKALDSGRYKNVSEVVRAALRLLERQDQEEEAKLEALRDAFKEGREAYESGELAIMESDADIDRFFDQLEGASDQTP